MESRFHDAATSEARKAAFYYERQGPNLGVEFLAAVLVLVDEIGAHPRRFAEVEGARGIARFGAPWSIASPIPSPMSCFPTRSRSSRSRITVEGRVTGDVAGHDGRIA
jgi:hypothetical protein